MQNTEIQKLADLKAEASVIGSIVLDSSTIPAVSEIVKSSEYFTVVEYQNVWNAVQELFKSGKKIIDFVLIRNQLQKMGILGSSDVSEFVEAAMATPTAANAVYYSCIVRDKYLRRSVVDNAKNMINMANDFERTIEDIYSDSQKIIRESYQEDATTQQYSMLLDALGSAGSDSTDTYITSGFDSVDNLMYGIGKGHLTIIGARPGNGKTSFLCEMALRIVENGCKSVAIFSLEQTKKDMADRFIFNRARINSRDCYRRWMPPEMIAEEKKIKHILSGYPILLDETRYLTLEVLRRRIYQFIEMKHCDVIMVDYLQLIQCAGRNKSRYEAVSEISMTMKSIAMEFNIPVIAACQLNRASEGRDDKRPRLSDLRESGNLEQDADSVILLHSPSVAFKNGQTDKDGDLIDNFKNKIDMKELQVLIEKNRRGETGMIKMIWEKEYGRITEQPK